MNSGEELDLSARELVCVLFPGVVKNDEKALECLGGIKNISQINSHPNKKRLCLSFQPENPFMKKIYADNKKAAGVLLKVKIKKKKDGNEVKREVVSTTVIGRVKKMHKFDSMCDFQYLPVDTEGMSAGQEPRCVLDNLITSGIDTLEFLSKPVPRFIMPSYFTRTEKPINYAYTDKRYPEKKIPSVDDSVHQQRRAERTMPVAWIKFNLTDPLPTEPNPLYLQRRDLRMSLHPEFTDEYEAIKKMFDERPILSMNRIRYETKLRLLSIKIVLPCLSVNIKRGPWRMLWVRFGYDPRKDPGARMYQTLDFRLRHAGGVHSMVMTRDQVVNVKKIDRIRRRSITRSYDSTEEVSEAAVYFRPGTVPSQRQVFYQYCDIKLPVVQALVAQEPPPGALCHAVRGWMPPGAEKTARDQIFNSVKETLLATHNADLRFEQASSDEDGQSDDPDTDPFGGDMEESFIT